MEYKLLAHDEYSHPDHPPAETVEVGDTVVLVFKGLEGYKVTEARLAEVVDGEVDAFVANLIEPGMMIPVAAGERVTFTLRQAFQSAPFGDETLLTAPET
jgi:hypothetical protein